MAEVERFGVFLPSYIWDGDGPERARGIKEFARTVEDLGFDSLFITDHLLVGKRFYSVNWLEPILSYPGRVDVALHIEPVAPVVASDQLRKQRGRLESSRRSDAGLSEQRQRSD